MVVEMLPCAVVIALGRAVNVVMKFPIDTLRGSEEVPLFAVWVLRNELARTSVEGRSRTRQAGPS